MPQKQYKYATLRDIDFQRKARLKEMYEEIRVLEIKFSCTSEKEDTTTRYFLQRDLGILYKEFMDLVNYKKKVNIN